MKQVKEIILTLLAICLFTACSNDDESNFLTGPKPSAYQYEENPNTLEGTWHLTKAFFSFGGTHEFEPGDVTVYFNPNHTMQVVNKSETKEMKPFMDSGFYSYEIIRSQTNQYDGTVLTTISIEGSQCTYWFKDGMMTLDYGMAYDAPGYFFKKLKSK